LDLENEILKEKMFYKKSDLQRVQSVLSDRRRLANVNENEHKNYDKFLKDTEAIRTEVFEAYRDACEMIQVRERAISVYDKHLSLADGNVEIAKNFFREAYKNDPDVIKFVFGKIGSPDPKPDSNANEQA
jgi:hypothetical protein